MTTHTSHSFGWWLPELTDRLDALDYPGCNFQGLGEFREHLGGELTIFLQTGHNR